MGWKEDRKSAYLEKLKDPRWQQIRLRVFERDKWTCLLCGNAQKTLCVHHRRYLPKREPWEYDLSDLATLCWDCHNDEHEIKDDATSILLDACAHSGWFYSDIYQLAGFIHMLGMEPELPNALSTSVANDESKRRFLECVMALYRESEIGRSDKK